MKWIRDLFDGDITKKDIKNALARFMGLALIIICSIILLDNFQSDTIRIDKEMNPLYTIAQDSTINDKVRAQAMDKLSLLASKRQATNFWQTILHSSILMFFWIVVASISAYAFTKLKWTENIDQNHENACMYQKQKINALIAIFSVVFITGSIIYLADKL